MTPETERLYIEKIKVLEELISTKDFIDEHHKNYYAIQGAIDKCKELREKIIDITAQIEAEADGKGKDENTYKGKRISVSMVNGVDIEVWDGENWRYLFGAKDLISAKNAIDILFPDQSPSDQPDVTDETRKMLSRFGYKLKETICHYRETWKGEWTMDGIIDEFINEETSSKLQSK